MRLLQVSDLCAGLQAESQSSAAALASDVVATAVVVVVASIAAGFRFDGGAGVAQPEAARGQAKHEAHSRSTSLWADAQAEGFHKNFSSAAS
mmetsp:Transcript_4785/g.13420  ORF Transcript_4785/g.13420 Transcript_4785/m.13420 type:complete len:92 (-) Transcript_4785:882-1157(-)